MVNNLWFFEFQHKFIHKMEFDVPSCWRGVSSSSHRYVVIVDLRSKLFDQMSISLTLGICLCNFCFRSSAFLLALSLFGPLFKLLHMCVRERARMWAFIYVSYTLTKWREKKSTFNGDFVKSNWKSFYFFEKKKYNILIIQLIVRLLSMAIFYYTKNKWMTGWMNEWMNENTHTRSMATTSLTTIREIAWRRRGGKNRSKKPSRKKFNSNAEIQLETYGTYTSDPTPQKPNKNQT